MITEGPVSIGTEASDDPSNQIAIANGGSATSTGSGGTLGVAASTTGNASAPNGNVAASGTGNASGWGIAVVGLGDASNTTAGALAAGGHCAYGAPYYGTWVAIGGTCAQGGDYSIGGETASGGLLGVSGTGCASASKQNQLLPVSAASIAGCANGSDASISGAGDTSGGGLVTVSGTGHADADGGSIVYASGGDGSVFVTDPAGVIEAVRPFDSAGVIDEVGVSDTVGVINTGGATVPTTPEQAVLALETPDPEVVADKIKEAALLERGVTLALAQCVGSDPGESPASSVVRVGPERPDDPCDSTSADSPTRAYTCPYEPVYCPPKDGDYVPPLENNQQRSWWCGPASTSILLSSLGISRSQSALATAWGIYDSGGTAPSSIVTTTNKNMEGPGGGPERVTFHVPTDPDNLMSLVASDTWDGAPRQSHGDQQSHALIANVWGTPLPWWQGVRTGSGHFNVMYGFDLRQGGHIDFFEVYDPRPFRDTRFARPDHVYGRRLATLEIAHRAIHGSPTRGMVW